MSPRSFRHEPIDFRRMPAAIRGLIMANVIVYLVSQISGGKFFDMFGLVPQHVLVDRWIWQPFTYLFVHGGFMHLLFNLFALWMFGMPVESQWGQWEFLKYYFLCGLGAAAASLILSPGSTLPIIGASGPVYGMLVAFAMLYPDAVVYLYFLIPVKASHMAILFGVIEFFTGVSGSTPTVARYAHLGGMVTGYVYIRWWWVIKVKARELGRRVSGAAPKSSRAGRVRPEPAAVPVDDRPPMAEIDRILDKILVSGIDSLTDEEKAIMRKYSDQSRQH